MDLIKAIFGNLFGQKSDSGMSQALAQHYAEKADLGMPVDNSGPVVAAPHTVAEYEAKFKAAKVRPEKMAELKSICGKILMNQLKYQEVSNAVGLPWWVVACIHEKEASLNFGTYLQNGDPLFAHDGSPLKTVHVPRGVGPFDPQTWVNAAIHALGGAGAHKKDSWTVGDALLFCENYNGAGYRKRGQPSPYVWSFTDQYVKGHYVADGVYDPNAVDRNPGVAAMLKVLGIT